MFLMCQADGAKLSRLWCALFVTPAFPVWFWQAYLYYETSSLFVVEKGSVESTHKVPTSHYHAKHCHAVVASLGGLTHRRGFSRIRPPTPVPATLHLSAPGR